MMLFSFEYDSVQPFKRLELCETRHPSRNKYIYKWFGYYQFSWMILFTVKYMSNGILFHKLANHPTIWHKLCCSCLTVWIVYVWLVVADHWHSAIHKITRTQIGKTTTLPFDYNVYTCPQTRLHTDLFFLPVEDLINTTLSTVAVYAQFYGIGGGYIQSEDVDVDRNSIIPKSGIYPLNMSYISSTSVCCSWNSWTHYI